ncbi:hypothetical protein ACJMK2_007073 [Sinanodonta woodiana]|uniref:Uncharacterized protein n=1 Tax=Sinanodonta woodiana TaxID=1069815 RepID=A0ABD3VKH7_SINWO
MNILHLALCLSCLTEVSALTGNETECSSRCETGAGGYFKLEKDTMKRIQVSKGFHVKMFVMSSKSIFDVEVVECSVGTKSLVGGFNRNLETYESKENEIEVRVNAYSTQLDIQWWRVCGGSVVGYSGKLIGPDHASGYPENETCIWNITVLNGYMLLLNLSIEGYNESTNCSLDYIQVMEIESEEMISRGPICSGMLNWKSNTSIQILFQSDFDSTSGLSFNASWVSKCGDTFYADNGELASPDNYEDFSFNVQCNWTISVSPGHTIVINYTFPKTSNRDAGCKSYVQVTEADSDASKILCQSRTFAVHKSSSNIVRISFTYQPGMNYTWFYAQWHSERAQMPNNKVSNTDVGQVESSNTGIKDKDNSGSTKTSVLTLLEKYNNVTKVSVADAILQTAAAPLAIVIIIIIAFPLVWCAKSRRCFARRHITYDMKENIYNSLNEIDITAENCKQQIREKNFNPETFRRRLPTLPPNRLSEILGRVRKGIQLRNERYDTVHGEQNEGFHLTALGDHTEPQKNNQEDKFAEEEIISIRNESTLDNFRNVGYISSDNVDEAKSLSVSSTRIIKTDCIINKSAMAMMGNEDNAGDVDDYLTPGDNDLTPVDDNITHLDDYLIPVDDNLTHVDDYLTPVDDNVTTVDDSLTPVDDNLTPFIDTATPLRSCIAPVDDNLTTIDNYITPVDDNLTPVDEYLTPVDDYLTPVNK